MIGSTPVGMIGSCIFLLLVVCNASHCTPADQAQMAKSTDSTKDAGLIYLDSKNPSITQPIGASEAMANAKFVRVEVTEVRNPKRYALTFEVHYQPKGGARIYLGSFSLFPADNPGAFIVGTQDKVQQVGSIVLSMVVVDPVTDEPPKAVIKRITLTKE